MKQQTSFGGLLSTVNYSLDGIDNPRWYEEFVPIADDLFDRHLEELEQRK